MRTSTGRGPEVRAEVFLDAAYAIALAAPSDQLHMRAVVLAQQLEADRTRMVTTQRLSGNSKIP